MPNWLPPPAQRVWRCLSPCSLEKRAFVLQLSPALQLAAAFASTSGSEPVFREYC